MHRLLPRPVLKRCSLIISEVNHKITIIIPCGTTHLLRWQNLDVALLRLLFRCLAVVLKRFVTDHFTRLNCVLFNME